ncbi:ATP-binding cassette domain-containing protein [Frankia sp. AgB1.9]|uniref:ABC transporter ATP-binding protein n=1 Tax=unclassified Frankia TaxID=2632575 RepID=UPI001931AEFB|nr:MULTISPECIES: ATP-binding cassette domain-containing protein [unclassified Frankia]MBL7486734.1 ATP-binding cassette domain-containing protein [Frankia sp. AgW1.1]MBL7551801.1 ATP-binding cassette domain-containing protein [Frankia sp. AgB1.9]MBL7623158.1 ATP-binding cassette domain-containing protein [Frankia sp. AgB1.8]
MIEIRELTKRYGGRTAVDRLTFDVTPGQVTGFLGPNGSGKSTTLRMIVGLDQPTSGTATVHGRRYRDIPAPMREVGVLLDAKAAPGMLKARQHLGWLARAGGVPAGQVDAMIELVGLASVADKRIGGFSLGMSQRLGIAAALLGDPGTLLLDEPVNGLDPEGIRWVRTLLRRLAAEGRTVVVSSHLMSEMEDTADRVVVIGRGRLIANAGVAEFTAASTSTHVRVASPRAGELEPILRRAGATVAPGEGDLGDGDLGRGGPRGGHVLVVTGRTAAEVGELAAAHGIALHELTQRRASLEAAFMELTHDSVDYRGDAATASTVSGED